MSEQSEQTEPMRRHQCTEPSSPHMRWVAVAAPILVTALALVSTPLHTQPEQSQSQSRSQPEESGDALAQSTPRALLAQRAVVQGSPTSAGQLVRLPLDVDVLGATHPDLSDLRLYLGDQQLSFFVRRAPRAKRTLLETLQAKLGPQLAQRATSASQQTPIDVTESYWLTPPPGEMPTSEHASTGRSWQLRLAVPRASGAFVAQVRLSRIVGDSSEPQPLYSGAVFRLKDGRERLTVPLPADLGKTEWLRVDLERQDIERGTGTALEPRFYYESFEDFEQGTQRLEVEVDHRLESTPNGAIYSFELPSGLVPDSFRLDTNRGNFDRSIRVFGAAASLGLFGGAAEAERQLLASGRIYRFRSADRTSEPSLEIEVANSNTTAFEIEIDGGDSPPLEELSITALVRQPEVIFEWPAVQAAAAEVELLFGGGRVAAAKFDLWSRTTDTVSSEQVRSIEFADRMEVRTQLDGEGLPLVRRAEITANPDYDATPLLAFLQRPGSQVDSGLFAFEVPITLVQNETGLHVVELGPSVQVHLREDGGDLRFVDDEGQWPYILRSGGERWVQELELETAREGTESHYSFSLPDSSTAGGHETSIRAESVKLVVKSAFFDRAYVLEARNAGDHVVATTSGRLTPGSARSAFHAPGRTETSVTLTVPRARAHHFQLEVEDGDDAPLEVSTATLSGPGLAAFLVAPPGEYRALIGARTSDIGRPNYEIARASNLVLSLRGDRVTLDTLQPIVAWRWASIPWQTILLWSAIVIAVVGLGWATFRSVS